MVGVDSEWVCEAGRLFVGRVLKAVGWDAGRLGRRNLSVPWCRMADMESGVRVVASAALSSGYDRRYVVVDAATGEIVDDAQGYGYKSAQNAHRAHGYKSMPSGKKRQRAAIKKQVRRWCDKHGEFTDDVDQAMFYAMKAGAPLPRVMCSRS